MLKEKKRLIIILVVLAVVFAGVATVILMKHARSYGEIVELPMNPGSDAGRKIVIRLSGGKKQTISIGGAFTQTERCGTIKGELKQGARVLYNLLPGNKFCAYDETTNVSNVYIRVLP